MDQHQLATSGERDGLWDWNLASSRMHYSPRWMAMIGCEDHEIGTSPEEWLGRIHPEDQKRVRDEIERHLLEGDGFLVQHRLLHQDGTYRWMDCRGVVVRDEAGKAIRVVGSHSDVTGQAVTDPQTGLPNRLRFLDRLTLAAERARRTPNFLYAVFLIEIPPTAAALQESESPSAGHPLLAAAARRLETCLHARDDTARPEAQYLVARMRGVQFAILLEGLTRVDEAEMLAERVLADLLVAFQVSGRQVFLHPSIGVAVSATGCERSEQVLGDADAALHRAKSLGGNRWEAFDTTVFQSSRTQSQLATDLEGALDRGELRLVYQPILSLATNRIVGFEALLRWDHPTLGVVALLEFIPIAEKSGLIVAIGRWVMREACLQVKAWRDALPAAPDLWVSVNVSSLQLERPELVDETARMLHEIGVPPACLMLELTESVAMANPAAVKGLLMQLRVMGVRIGLDDFGTGQSSFAYLHQFPVDFVKIDRSFLVGMNVRQEKTAIVATLTDLAGRLGLQLIAEGIETEEQLAAIRSLRCECGQGFLFSRPVDSALASDLLRRDRPPEQPNPPPLIHLPARRARALRPAILAAGTLVLVSAGLAALLGGRTLHTGQPAARPIAASVVPPVRPPLSPEPANRSAPPPATPTGGSVRASSPTGVAPAAVPAPRPAVPAPRPAVPAPRPVPPAPKVLSFPVVHQHAFGSCRGQLSVSASGVSYQPEKGTHAFTLEYGLFLSSLADDKLTIKSEDRVYRFKSADASGQDENLTRLKQVLASIAKAQKR
jgi:diguanylate cyclase (GGDEF)-like protein/PAS domain S-box-containing protein